MAVLKLDEHIRVAGKWLNISSEANFLTHTIKFHLDDQLVYEEKKGFPFELHEKVPQADGIVVKMKAGAWGDFELEIVQNEESIYRSKGYMLP